MLEALIQSTQGICLGLPQAGIGTLLYLTWPTTTRTLITVSNIAEQRLIVLLINIGKASHNLYLVLQGSAVV